jgi:large subunit ribosomal protein L25
MDTVKLENRKLTGKKCKQLLREGFVPCVVYNSKRESTNCQIKRGDAERLVRGITSATMLDIEIGEKKMKALIKDIDTDPRKDLLKHIAFFEIDEAAELTFEIPFALIGIAPAVKNSLGVLIQPTKEITVKARSKDLVPHIEVDVSKLENVGDAILLEDIEMPKGLKLFNEEDINNTIVTITELQKQVEEEPEEVEEEEGAEGEELPEGEEGTTTTEETPEKEEN